MTELVNPKRYEYSISDYLIIVAMVVLILTEGYNFLFVSPTSGSIMIIALSLVALNLIVQKSIVYEEGYAEGGIDSINRLEKRLREDDDEAEL